MRLQALLQELQKDYELKEPFEEEIPGVSLIPLDEGLNIRVSNPMGHILLECTILDAPIGKEEELYLNLLLANLFGQGTRGALLSLSEDARKLTLSRSIEYDINFRDFQDVLEDFINSIDFWREEALNYQQSIT